MAASALPLLERLTSQGAGSHLQGAERPQVRAIAGLAPLHCACKACRGMCLRIILGRGFHKSEGPTSLSWLSS